MSPRPDAELAIRALDMAYEMRERPKSVMFHSDQGSQYGARKFRQRLWHYQMMYNVLVAVVIVGTIAQWSVYLEASSLNGCERLVTIQRLKQNAM